jgi:putative transposase
VNATAAEVQRRLQHRLYQLRCYWLRQALALREHDGALAEAWVREVARRCEVSPRTFRRWVAGGQVPRGERPGVKVDERVRELLVETSGNVTATSEILQRERGRGYSRRNLARVVSEQVPADERREFRLGVEGRRKKQLRFPMSVERPNDQWHIDHKESSVYVVHPVTGEVVRPYISSAVDGHSSAAAAVLPTPDRPNARDVLALLFRAFVQTDDVPVGGLPFRVVWDNAPEFSADEVEGALSRLDIDVDPIDAYAPHQNGPAESFNSLIETRFSRLQLPYAHGARQRNKELYADEAHALQWNVLLHNLDRFVALANRELVHSRLKMPRERAWLAGDHAGVRTVLPSELLWLLPHAEATVTTKGIVKWNRRYWSSEPRFTELVDRRVDVHYLPHDVRTIEVSRGGEWICTASSQPVKQEDRQRLADVQGRRARAMSARRRRVNKRRHEENERLAAELGAAAIPDDAAASVEHSVAEGEGAAPPSVSHELDSELYDLSGLGGAA